MNQKTSIFIFSTMFMIIGALSVQAMEDTAYEQAFHAFLEKYEKLVKEEISDESSYSPGSLSQDGTEEASGGNSFVFKNFVIESREFHNVILHYQENPNADLKKLDEYFECIPKEQRIEALKYFESFMSRYFNNKFNNIKYTPEGGLIETPYKAKGGISYRDRLMGLSDQPNDSYQTDSIEEDEVSYQLELFNILSDSPNANFAKT